MTLPAAYALILADLNRDVLRAQPSDSLQFCANWFSSRLEAERISLRRQTGQASTSSPSSPISARFAAGGPASPPPTSTSTRALGGAPPAAAAAVNERYTFGGRPDVAMDVVVEPASTSQRGPSPQVQGGATPPYAPTSILKNRNSPNRNGTSPTSPKSGRAAGGVVAFADPKLHSPPSPRPPPSPAAAHENDEDDEDDEDVYDPRDDPNYKPPGSSEADPSRYNLGRRTSVSAESLDPTISTVKTVIAKSASQRSRIEASIAANLLFRNLDEDQHNDVLNAMQEVKVSKGTEVIVQGAVGDFFYVVESGTFEVWVRGSATHTFSGPGKNTVTTPGVEKQVATIGPGGSFGELALMYNSPRAATVVATTEATLWALDRVTFRSILMEHTSRKRKMYETFLMEVPILASLNPKERVKVADALEAKVYEEGMEVIIEGEVGKNFYIIESGKAQVSRRKNGHEEEVLGTLGKGDYFGELALLNSAPRAATVRAMQGQGRLRVATLGEQAFTRLLGPIMDILQRQSGSYSASGAGAGAGRPLGGGGEKANGMVMVEGN